jgi:hypothetical protein
MANLPSLAQRLNDIEINNNAPVSSQTNRRIGSDVNFLLDYLNVTDGQSVAGPSAGLNIFSPVQTISYSYTFSDADVNIPRVLYTFQGGGDRPLYFFKRDSQFREQFAYVGGNNFFPVSLVNVPAQFPPYFQPVSFLLNSLNSIPGGSGGLNSIIFLITVNGVEMGRTTRNGRAPNLQQTREITHAPAGTNTLSVTLLQTFGNALPTLNVSGSFNYVAL